MGKRGDRFCIEVSERGRVVDVRATGEVDIVTVGALRSVLWAAPADSVLRLNLTGVRVLSTAGVRALVAAHLRLRAGGGELVLVRPGPTVVRVLRDTGLHRVVRVVTDAPDPIAGSTLIAA